MALVASQPGTNVGDVDGRITPGVHETTVASWLPELDRERRRRGAHAAVEGAVGVGQGLEGEEDEEATLPHPGMVDVRARTR